jgi:hypothetical protein
MGKMNNKKALAMTLILVLMFLFLIMCRLMSFYASKSSFDMIYKLKPGERLTEAAERFKVNAADIKVDGDYLVFEIK